MRMPRTVLLVDDDPQLTTVVAEMLHKRGFSIASASASSKALMMCAHSKMPFDLLITDVGTPKINGTELARLAQARRPSMKVLYMSGDEATLESLRQQALP